MARAEGGFCREEMTNRGEFLSHTIRAGEGQRTNVHRGEIEKSSLTILT